MQPKLKNRYIIFIGFNDVGEALCIQFHDYPDTDKHDGISRLVKYQTRDLGDMIDGYSIVSIFLATKPELHKCYQYFQKKYPLLVKGLKANTHPASKRLFKQILHYSDKWLDEN